MVKLESKIRFDFNHDLYFILSLIKIKIYHIPSLVTNCLLCVCVCVLHHTAEIPGAGRSNFALLSSDMDACSCSITKSSSKKKSLDKVSCKNSTSSSIDNFIRCPVITHAHNVFSLSKVDTSWCKVLVQSLRLCILRIV